MTEEEYLRDAYYRTSSDVAEDILAEQEKINSSDAIVFMYPVFWSEAPAKLVGWFDRVWSYGFAYGERTMKVLDKALVLCSVGNPRETLERFGFLESMKKVMLGDRLFGRAKRSGIHCLRQHLKGKRASREEVGQEASKGISKGGGTVFVAVGNRGLVLRGLWLPSCSSGYRHGFICKLSMDVTLHTTRLYQQHFPL